MVRLIYDGGNTKSEQGAFGEQIIGSLSKVKAIKNQEHFLYNDFYVEKNGRVYQIDHIFVMHNGVFVVETKMMNGIVKGKANDKHWISMNYGRKTQFLNPIYQNELHTNAIRYVLGSKYPIYSVIVFAWKNKPKECNSKNVMNVDEFFALLKQGQSNQLLSFEDMQKIKNILDNIQYQKDILKMRHDKIIEE